MAPAVVVPRVLVFVFYFILFYVHTSIYLLSLLSNLSHRNTKSKAKAQLWVGANKRSRGTPGEKKKKKKNI